MFSGIGLGIKAVAIGTQCGDCFTHWTGSLLRVDVK